MDKKIKRKRIFAAVLIVMTAMNLRAPITCIGSLVNIISEEFELSSTAAGSITTIPLLAFAVISPAAVFISGKLGAGRTMFLSFAVMSAGILLRSYAGEIGLFAGTLVTGGAIAMGNVLLPAIIKSCFPYRIESMTSLYTVIMQVVSTVSTGISVPVAAAFGWQKALAVWMIPAAFALLSCLMNSGLVISGEKKDRREGKRRNAIYKKGMAWWITCYMGVQSMIFYTFIAWLSPMMQDRGYDQVFSGCLLSAYVLMGMAGSAVLPFIMGKNRTQSSTGIQLGVLYLVGIIFVMCTDLKSLSIAGIMLCGFCSGTCISFSMSLFGLHTSNGEDASRLSAMAQSVGYLMAAAGPVLIGKMYGYTGGWMFPMGFMAACTLFLIVAGKRAGREEVL